MVAPSTTQPARRRLFGTGPARLADVVRIRESASPPTIRVPLDEIDPSPRNPRQRVDVDELVASIRAYGLLQPIVVRRVGPRYELVAGHRRYAAVKALADEQPGEARWREVEAVLRQANTDEAYLLTLAENLQRVDLAPKEEAAALEVLVRQEGWSLRKVAEAIHRDPMYVQRRLAVFDDPVLAGPVLANRLPVSTAGILVRVKGETRAKLVDRAVAEGWTQEQARRAVTEETQRDRRLNLQTEAELRRRLRDAAELLAGWPQGLELSPEAQEDARRLLVRLGAVLPS
jgi:ParB/RepB/Spo0J family partition protein